MYDGYGTCRYKGSPCRSLRRSKNRPRSFTDIWPEESFNASWQVLWTTLVSWFPSLKSQSPSRGTVSNARARLPFEFWKRLFNFISEQAQDLSGKYDRWRGHRVVLLDGTCVSMADNEDLFEEFGRATGYPACEIVELYGKRWRIETLFREVKINLSADVLRSKTAQGIRKEIASRLVAINLVRTIMLEAAIADGVEPLRISFIHAVRAIISFSPALASEPLWKLLSIYQAMLSEIASHVVPERLGRNEPRAVTRERKHYPKLKSTRGQ